MTAPSLHDRLVARIRPRPGDEHDVFSNPDGPEAAEKIRALERMVDGFVRRYGDYQDGNGNTPTEIRRAIRDRQARLLPTSTKGGTDA